MIAKAFDSTTLELLEEFTSFLILSALSCSFLLHLLLSLCFCFLFFVEFHLNAFHRRLTLFITRIVLG